MSFTVVKAVHGNAENDAVLLGIASGYAKLYPVPDHPPGISDLLRNQASSETCRQAQPAQLERNVGKLRNRV